MDIAGYFIQRRVTSWLVTLVLGIGGLLAFLGILSTVGLVPLAAAGGVALWLDGPNGLLRPGWLVWGQIATAPLMALSLPLATAGYLVAYEELGLRLSGK